MACAAKMSRPRSLTETTYLGEITDCATEKTPASRMASPSMPCTVPSPILVILDRSALDMTAISSIRHASALLRSHVT